MKKTSFGGRRGKINFARAAGAPMRRNRKKYIRRYPHPILVINGTNSIGLMACIKLSVVTSRMIMDGIESMPKIRKATPTNRAIYFSDTCLLIVSKHGKKEKIQRPVNFQLWWR